MQKTDFIKAFKSIGIQNGMALEVHSSLSSFGYVEGGAETVIEALLECVEETGSIFMPALRLSPPMELSKEDKSMGITVKIKVLPADAPRTDMGIIADTFRQRSDVSDIFKPSEEVRKKYPSDEWFIETGEPPIKAWYTIQDMAYQKGIIQEGYIGKCKYMFFGIWDVVSLYKRELENNPFKLYGLEV